MSIVCGIYCIYFNNTDKVYIGQSTNIYDRWMEHKRTYKKGNARYKLKEAFQVYGEPQFLLLEECKASELNIKEIAWIEEFNSVKNGFNICSGGKSGHGAYNGTSIYSEEQLLKVFDMLQLEPPVSYSDIATLCIVNYSLVSTIASGQAHTYLASELPTEYEKMLKVNRKRLLLAHKIVGEATCAKSLGIIYPILIDINGNEYIIDNATKFAEKHGMDPSCLVKVLNGKRKTHKGFKLKDPEVLTQKIKKEYPILISPIGEEVVINTHTLAEFARINFINKSALCGLLNGRVNQTNGWILKP